ncbi:MAG TPA: hypothetical protein VMC84_09240 [Methanocella sp.]|uniref:hypothetical protein n=1 Tax=Methanocella sp. TaxID=2052833 RepID=UPI002C988CC7|nr:hypothetical protein [Methanocella sp.]HTY91347.1 hypothetical protein [Methanocella sp.]
MLKLLKQSIVVAILLVMAVSFTIGSVSATDNATDNNKVSFGYAPDSLHDDQKYTRVFLDLRGEGNAVEVHGWQTLGPMPPAPFTVLRHGYGGPEFIEGKMMVIPAGEDMPRMLPVMFFKHEMHDSGRVSFMADATYRLNNTEMSFKGEIQLLNDTIVQTDVSSGLYDNEIAPGQTNWHQVYVSGSPASLSFELKWNNTDDRMRIVVYTPDGKTLGPYYDNSDGTVDNTINMVINNPSGVANGPWSFKVTDTGVTGKDEYYLKTW